MKKFTVVLRRAAVLVLVLCSGSAIAQPYPSRAITMVVPFSAGGALDALARVLASRMADSLGQPVVIENRTGGGGSLGMGSVARSQPDGYTVLYTPNSVAIMPAFYRKLSFDPEKDLAPVSQFASTTLVMAVHPKLGVGTVKELVALAKSRPGKLNFGSSGVADPLQLGIEMLKTMTGIDMLPIPYKGQAPMFTALLAGEVDVAIVSLQLALAPARMGTLKVLAVTGPKRSIALPSVPTMAESGLVGYDLTSWHGIFAPAGTPRDVIDRLSREIARVANLPDVRQRIEATGNETVGSTPEEFEAKYRSDIARFKKIVQDAKLPLQD
jgi:tripartite-type tricarboxylate transporter receptor subunit TctC